MVHVGHEVWMIFGIYADCIQGIRFFDLSYLSLIYWYSKGHFLLRRLREAVHILWLSSQYNYNTQDYFKLCVLMVNRRSCMKFTDVRYPGSIMELMQTKNLIYCSMQLLEEYSLYYGRYDEQEYQLFFLYNLILSYLTFYYHHYFFTTNYYTFNCILFQYYYLLYINWQRHYQ